MNRYKWYRKLLGGTWYKISYTEKRNGGMDKVKVTLWGRAFDIIEYEVKFNAEIIKIEKY